MRSNPTLFLAEPKGEDEMASSLLDALGFNETIDCKVMKPANKLISSLFLPLFFFFFDPAELDLHVAGEKEMSCVKQWKLDPLFLLIYIMMH